MAETTTTTITPTTTTITTICVANRITTETTAITTTTATTTQTITTEETRAVTDQTVADTRIPFPATSSTGENPVTPHAHSGMHARNAEGTTGSMYAQMRKPQLPSNHLTTDHQGSLGLTPQTKTEHFTPLVNTCKINEFPLDFQD